ncbi:N-acetylmuramoyl-L-alanine amidase [Clostridium hydrogenum]|uniref:N-acetylmuramoyl-L-alanine amidase n=1 Tax=Clostridium hydrogenum TaxID=2855764 RepID=UPI001F1EB23F|nr:N-acetylmuramoyl-L-alanine amidase [Clostridium hydrogenum]
MLRKGPTVVSSKILMVFFTALIVIVFMFIPTNFVQAATQTQYKGVDISNWAGVVDINKVKNAGYSFVISKITEGTTYVDPYGKQNIANTKSNGLIAGAYHFARFTDKAGAIQEANFFKQNCPANVDFVVLDFEQQCSGDMTDACLAFLDSVSSIAPAIIYCNPSYINSYLNSKITKYPLWIANYGVQSPKTPLWGTYAIWQYDENGQVPGINGAVDMDISGPAFATILGKKVDCEPEINLGISDGQTYSSNSLDLKGWALNTSGVKNVDIYVDGKFVKSVDSNLPTPDLANQYSQYSNAANSGFDYIANLSEGAHKIKVFAAGNDGSNCYKEVNVNVNTGISSQANIIASKTDVDTTKTWSIKFNSKVDASTVNSKTILVYDNNNNIVNVGISYDENTNEVIVSPPSSGYENGEKYTIEVTNGVKSDSGKALKALTIMNFTTKASNIPSPQTNYTITIDAAHGGDDSGATGQSGTVAKNINLDIALEVGNILKQHNVNVIYTRTTDQTEDSQTRCNVANTANSNLFVSIDVNSYTANNAYGTETYYYPGSSNGQALANSIQNELVNDLGTYNRGVKTGTYTVLQNTNAPAVVTDVAFITNDKEEQELNDASFRDKAAEAIADGILKYLGSN